MNTTTLIASIAKTNKISKAQSQKLVKSVFETISYSVKKGQPVRIADFGTFKAVKYKARTVRSPFSGETIKIAAKKLPKFKAGAAFKKLVK